MQATASNKDEFKIPDELTEAYFISKGIRWTDYRAMPKHLIEEISFLWQLESINSKRANRS